MSVLDRFRCTLKITCSTVENNKITSVEDYLYNPFSAVGFPAKISCLSRSGGSPELESMRYSRFFFVFKSSRKYLYSSSQLERKLEIMKSDVTLYSQNYISSK